MKSRQVRTTQAHFCEFKKWCEHWQEDFGLKSWVMNVEWSRMQDTAHCVCMPFNREFTLRLKKGLIPRENAENIKWLAFHEIGEALLWNLGEMGETGRKFSFEDVQKEKHIILNTFENMVRKMERE